MERVGTSGGGSRVTRTGGVEGTAGGAGAVIPETLLTRTTDSCLWPERSVRHPAHCAAFTRHSAPAHVGHWTGSGRDGTGRGEAGRRRGCLACRNEERRGDEPMCRARRDKMAAGGERITRRRARARRTCASSAASSRWCRVVSSEQKADERTRGERSRPSGSGERRGARAERVSEQRSEERNECAPT